MKFRSNGTKGFNIHFDDTNANEKLKIQSDDSSTTPSGTTDMMTLVGPQGYIGIGTDSPGEKLEVRDGNISLRAGGSSVADSDIGKVMFKHNAGGIVANLCEIVGVGDTNGSVTGGGPADGQSGRLEFRTLPSTSSSDSSGFVPSTRMTIDSNGNVGIGIHNPGFLFQVNGDAYAIRQSVGEWVGKTTGHNIDFNTTNKIRFKTNSLERMTIDTNGKVGIGSASTPAHPLHVGDGTYNSNMALYVFDSNRNRTSYSSTRFSTSIKANHFIWGQGFFHSSDERIKKNIIDVPDNLSLEMVRNIPCRYYEYKDDIKRGQDKTIGFIAQEVKEVMPMAVGFQTDYIPNELRKLTDIIWNNTTLYTNLSNCSGIKYRFYVSNDPSDNYIKEVVGNADDSFTFDQSYNYVFCYGKEVDDFHTVDKDKLFALNFSATQEIDKIQQEEKTKLAAAEAEITTLKTQLAAVLARLDSLESN